MIMRCGLELHPILQCCARSAFATTNQPLGVVFDSLQHGTLPQVHHCPKRSRASNQGDAKNHRGDRLAKAPAAENQAVAKALVANRHELIDAVYNKTGTHLTASAQIFTQDHAMTS